MIKMSQVVISVTLHGDVEGGVDDESGFYFELEKALGQVAQEFGLNAHIDDVHDNADGGLMQLDNFEKAWGVVKNTQGKKCPNCGHRCGSSYVSDSPCGEPCNTPISEYVSED